MMRKRPTKAPSTKRGEDSTKRYPIQDSDLFVVVSKFPTGNRDFAIYYRISDQELEILNPLELLGTDMAVRILEHISNTVSPEAAKQLSLSRLLAQCLEYRGNRRHLINEPWTESDLRGESLFEGNRTQLARDCSAEQARQFKLVMSGESLSDQPQDELYGGTFSTLPHVDAEFNDEDLAIFGTQLETLLVGYGEGQETVPVVKMKSKLGTAWDSYFKDFESRVEQRRRRDLFKRRLSVAVRQASGLTERIAFALAQKAVADRDPDSPVLSLTERERLLFDLRYGSCEVLGGINIGFLHDCGELHAELVNKLAQSLVSVNSDADWQQAADELRKHVFLLNQLRNRRRAVRAAHKRETRQLRQDRLPAPRVQASKQPDAGAASPDQRAISQEFLSQLMQMSEELKPRDQDRVRALIDADGNRGAAAASLGISREKFNRQFRQTTKGNIEKAWAKLKSQEEG